MSERWPSPWADALEYLDEIGYGDFYVRPGARPPAAAAVGDTQPAPAPRPEAPVRKPSPAPPAPVRQTPVREVPVPPTPPSPVPVGDLPNDLGAVAERASQCTACRLCNGRQNVVFGSGNPNADLMFIGEGPGAEEDRRGLPFVGPAGELLTKIIRAIDLDRDQVYIANMVKCRPPRNRDPEADEVAACRPFLEAQIDLVKPRLLVALGRVAAQALLETTESLGRLRGRWHEVSGLPTRVTYHPAALLRNRGWKRPTWEDMQIVRDRLRQETQE